MLPYPAYPNRQDECYRILIDMMNAKSFKIILCPNYFCKLGSVIVSRSNIHTFCLFIFDFWTRGFFIYSLLCLIQFNYNLFWVNIFEYRNIFFYLCKQFLYFIYRNGILLNGVSILEMSRQYGWDSRYVVRSSK